MECVRINILYFQKELVNICLHKDTKESSEMWKGAGTRVTSSAVEFGKGNVESECTKCVRMTGTKTLFLSLFPFKWYQPSKMQRLPALQSWWDLFGVPQLLIFEAFFCLEVELEMDLELPNQVSVTASKACCSLLWFQLGINASIIYEHSFYPKDSLGLQRCSQDIIIACLEHTL